MSTTYHYNHLNTASTLLHTNGMSHCIGNKPRTDQVNELRTQAFNELQQSIQSYNDSFVQNMRYQEKQARMQGLKKISANYGNELSSDEDVDDRNDWSQRSKEDRMMEELTVIFQAGTMNDYTPVLEWESDQNMPDSDQLTCGMC